MKKKMLALSAIGLAMIAVSFMTARMVNLGGGFLDLWLGIVSGLSLVMAGILFCVVLVMLDDTRL